MKWIKLANAIETEVEGTRKIEMRKDAKQARSTVQITYQIAMAHLPEGRYFPEHWM